MTWTRERVNEEVLTILSPHVQGDVTLHEGSHLVADLGLDSLAVMEVVADLEDTFELHVPDDALREVNTVADVTEAVTSRLTKAGRLSPAEKRAPGEAAPEEAATGERNPR